MTLLARAVVLLTMLSLAPAAAAGQGFGERPLTLGNGRVTLGGETLLTTSCALDGADGDCGADTGFFNYTDYERSLLRLLRLSLAASVNATSRLTVLGELRSENGSAPVPYALYVRLRPWTNREFDVQAGRIPPTFGAFARRGYGADNLLIGYPLAYQYLTSLRADAIPRSADELLAMRGRGWLAAYSVGNPVAAHGLPMMTALRWDTGIQAHAALPWIEGTAALTTGSLANPLVRDDNGGKQIVARTVLHPLPGLHVGASGARGAFLARTAVSDSPFPGSPGQFLQTAIGVDAEYSRDYYLVRAEVMRSRWTLPTLGEPLTALAGSVEGRYKIRPRLYVAARIDHLGFSTLETPERQASWDAPVSRVEIGGGYLLRRNLQLKASWQHNVRDGGRVRQLDLAALQVGYWF